MSVYDVWKANDLLEHGDIQGAMEYIARAQRTDHSDTCGNGEGK